MNRSCWPPSVCTFRHFVEFNITNLVLNTTSSHPVRGCDYILTKDQPLLLVISQKHLPKRSIDDQSLDEGALMREAPSLII